MGTRRRQGWVRDPDAVARVMEQLVTPVFGSTPAGSTEAPLPEAVYLWDACRKVTGNVLPARDQGAVGSCVGFGTSTAIEHTLCAEIASGDPDGFAPICQEIVYAGSRVEVGGGRLRGDGSVGAWAAEFVRRWGVVERGVHGRHDLSRYDAAACRVLGKTGVPNDLEPECRRHPVAGVARVLRFDEACRALAAGYGIAVCSNQGFGMRRDADGFAPVRGNWSHCMALVGYRRRGRAGGFILNSWGPTAHTGPVGPGNPPAGGFWADAVVVDAMLRQGDSWAFSRVEGVPARRVPGGED